MTLVRLDDSSALGAIGAPPLGLGTNLAIFEGLVKSVFLNSTSHLILLQVLEESNI